MDPVATAGFFVLAVALVVAAWLVAMVALFARRTDSLVEAMVQAAFLPEKRRRYLSLLSIEGSLFLDTALVYSLTSLGILPAGIGALVIDTFLLVGMVSVAALTWVGLRPGSMTDSNRADLRRAAPAFLYSLALAPSVAGPEESEPRSGPPEL